MNERVFVGLDVGRLGLHAVVRPAGQRWFVGTDAEGISEIAKTLASLQPEIVVLEAQGGVELPVAGALATSGLPLAFVSRRNIRAFACSVGGQQRGARTHAELLAHFAELVRPEVRPISSSVVALLQSLKAREQELLYMLSLERRRLCPEITTVQRSVRSHISFLERNVSSVGEEINHVLRASSIWR